MTRVLVPLAEGCEELEAVTIIDLLRRAGIEVIAAGLEDGPVTASRGVRLLPDMTLDEALTLDYDMVALPGVCAAPKVLAREGILAGKQATAFPGVLQAEEHPDITGNAVTRDGQVITSRSAGTVMDFALAIIEALLGRESRDTVEQSLARS